MTQLCALMLNKNCFFELPNQEMKKRRIFMFHWQLPACREMENLR